MLHQEATIRMIQAMLYLLDYVPFLLFSFSLVDFGVGRAK